MIEMNLRAATTIAGSITAVAGGLCSVAAEWLGRHHLFGAADAETVASTNTSVAGLIVAIGGLVTAILPQLHAALKLYLDERREERTAKWERHELANKLQAAEFQLAEIRANHAEDKAALNEAREIMTENRRLIERLSRAETTESGTLKIPPELKS